MSSAENVVWIEQPPEDADEIADEPIRSPPAFQSPTQRIVDEPLSNETFGVAPDAGLPASSPFAADRMGPLVNSPSPGATLTNTDAITQGSKSPNALALEQESATVETNTSTELPSSEKKLSPALSQDAYCKDAPSPSSETTSTGDTVVTLDKSLDIIAHENGTETSDKQVTTRQPADEPTQQAQEPKEDTTNTTSNPVLPSESDTERIVDPLEKLLVNMSEASRKARELRDHEALQQDNWEPVKRSPIKPATEDSAPKKTVRWFDVPSDSTKQQSLPVDGVQEETKKDATADDSVTKPLESPKMNESSGVAQTAKNEFEPISTQPSNTEAKDVGAASDDQQKEDTLALVDNDSSWDLDEYERKLRQNTQEALDLVDRLCEESRLAAEAEQNGGSREGQRHNLQDGVSAKHEDVGSVNGQKKNDSAADILVAEGEFEIESYRVSSSLMQEPTGVLLLPGRKLLILDDRQGLVVVNLHTRETIKAPPSDQWRHPESAVFVFNTEHILVLAECPDSEGNFFKSICRFDQQLQFVDKIEAPRIIRDKVVVQCRLCYVEKTQCIYVAVNTPNDGFLYEFGPNGKWIEVYNQRARTFADVQFFAVVGPVTELLLVESRRSYIRLVSIYNSRVAESAMLALCERAGALCVDEAGNYFVFDQATSKVSQHSRRNFEKVQEIALVTRAHCQMAASSGLLAVLSKNFRELRLYRYEEPAEEYTPVLPPHVQMTETIDMI